MKRSRRSSPSGGIAEMHVRDDAVLGAERAAMLEATFSSRRRQPPSPSICEANHRRSHLETWRYGENWSGVQQA
jgi:hypothetical protein